MTDFEQTLRKEAVTLPEAHRADVLTVVRYLKISVRDDEALEHKYDEAIKDAHATVLKYNIAEEENINAEVCAARDGK